MADSTRTESMEGIDTYKYYTSNLAPKDFIPINVYSLITRSSKTNIITSSYYCTYTQNETCVT